MMSALAVVGKRGNTLELNPEDESSDGSPLDFRKTVKRLFSWLFLR